MTLVFGSRILLLSPGIFEIFFLSREAYMKFKCIIIVRILQQSAYFSLKPLFLKGQMSLFTYLFPWGLFA